MTATAVGWRAGSSGRSREARAAGARLDVVSDTHHDLVVCRSSLVPVAVQAGVVRLGRLTFQVSLTCKAACISRYLVVSSMRDDADAR